MTRLDLMRNSAAVNPANLADHRASLETLNLERIRYQLDRCLRDAPVYLEQYRHDYETRFCLWEGQSRDGRRWQENLGTGEKVRPWEGASDVRTFTADEIVNERVETMMSGFRRGQFQVTSLRSAHAEIANKVNILLNWRVRNHLAAELARELELGAQWRETFGVAALGIWWDQCRRFTRKKVTLQMLIETAKEQLQQGVTAGAEALQQLQDPLMDEQTIAWLRRIAPILDRRGAKKILTEIRTTGETMVPQIVIAKNQPCWEALRLFLDVFCPVETASFEKARWASRRLLLSADDLIERVEVEGWDKEWAEALWQQRGKCYGALNDFRNVPLRTENHLGIATTGNYGSSTNEDYVEVWHHYYKAIEKESDAPALLRLVWSPLVPDGYGHHDLFGYDHGQLPFVELVRERIENAMADSRSVPEIATTSQATIKKQRDSSNDYSDMTTLPPLVKPPWRGNTEVHLGPAAQIVERKPNELRWMAPPSTGTTVAASIDERTTLALASYFGRPHEGVSPLRTAIAQEHLVGTWLSQVAAAARMSLSLEQQYMDTITAERVLGDPSTVEQLSRGDIQGQFAIALVFDAANLDPERLKMKLEGFKDFVLTFDTQQVVDRAKLARVAARWIDPDLAAEIVGTPQMASQREIDDEQMNLAKIVVGIEPTMVPEGQNYALRLQSLFQMLEANPLLKKSIEGRPDSMAILEARIKHLSTLAEQFGPNKEIGRTGAVPGLQKVAGALGGGGGLGGQRSEVGGQTAPAAAAA